MFAFLPNRSPWLDGEVVTSRSITAENPTGQKGAGGRAASNLGPGRKGRPCVPVEAGETITLADIGGNGRITRLWLTVPDQTEAGPFVLRDLVLRAYWDDAAAPSVEVPLGDFYCNGFGARCIVNSLPIVVAPTGGMNCFFPMPFRHRARLTLESEHPGRVDCVFYQVDYQLFSDRTRPAPYFHALWRRTAVTQPGVDHAIVPGITGRGAYVGTFLGIAALERYWWGEGEVKFYLDGDKEYPTICGTGTEDYVGGAWAFQEALTREVSPDVRNYSTPFLGYPQRLTEDTTGWSPYARSGVTQHGMYRWHVLDPVYFDHDLRVVVQQIGHDGRELFERCDDVSSVGYWYQDDISATGPTLAPASQRRPR
jgi:hypothetical protein